MKELRNKIEVLLEQQLLLQNELGIDDSSSRAILNEVKTGELIVAVVGEVNRGKSTFLNALMGSEVFPSRATVCTAGVTILDNGTEPSAEIHYQNGKIDPLELTHDKPGDILANYISRTNDDVKSINALKIKYPNDFSGNGILLVDTPGVNDPDSWREEITYNYLASADAVIMLLDPMKPLSASEVEFLRDKILDQSIKKLIFIANKIDHVNMEDREKIYDRLKNGLEEYIPNPVIHMVSSKMALESKLNGNDEGYTASGFKRFEEFLIDFLMKGRGGALLETKIQKCNIIHNVIHENIQNRIGALDKDKDEVGKKLMEAEKELIALDKKKERLAVKIEKEQEPIANKLKKTINAKINEFESMESSIINEPELPQLRQKVLRIQKDTIMDFGESVKKVNKKLMQDYGTESVDVMTQVKELLSGLNKQSIATAGTVEVNRENTQRENSIIEDNSVKSAATTGAVVGAGAGAIAASNAVFAFGGSLWAFTSLGVAAMGALTGGIGLIAGAGIAAYLKKQNQNDNSSTYVEVNDIVNNQKAAEAVRNFLKGMKNQGEAISRVIVESFGNSINDSIDNIIKDQRMLISNIKNDINSTEEQQKDRRRSLSDHSERLSSLKKEFADIGASIKLT